MCPQSAVSRPLSTSRFDFNDLGESRPPIVGRTEKTRRRQARGVSLCGGVDRSI